MIKYLFGATIFCYLLLYTYAVQAQDLDSLMELSAFTQESDLQKILNKNVTVSSQKGLTIRETPGIISLVTAEEIRNSGARDLIDILRMVPGFEVMQDVQFVMGIGLRGNWANEGKVMVMMDGQPFNELMYQTVAVGNHFPVDAIEQIEIIRGPGSAIYGGSAEYGVINIKTKAAQSLNGVRVYSSNGLHTDAVGRVNAGAMISQKSEKLSWDLSFFKGKSIITDAKEFEGEKLKEMYANPMNINLGLKAGGFEMRTMYDEFKTRDPYTFIYYKNFYLDMKYSFNISKKFKLIPQLRYLNQIPWAYGDIETGEYGTRARVERYYGSLTGSYDFSRRVNLSVGLISFEDKARDLLPAGDYFFGKDKLSLNNIAVFAQGLIKHRLANATLGFRYERNNKYGDAFVPRLGLTKKIENFHFKVLYSQAFRAPAIENIHWAVGDEGKIKPEKSSTFEIELGYQFTPEMLLAVNAFDLSTHDVIVYGSDVSYQNYPKSGAKGVELVYSIRKKNWYANLTYSYNHAISGSGVVPIYISSQTNAQYVGFPSQKITLNTNFYVTSRLSINPTFIYAGRRYIYLPVYDEQGEVVASEADELDPYLLSNFFVNYTDIVPGFTVGMGVYDLLNQKPSTPQAYDGASSPIPGRSREYVLKISYQINFKK